ncbi:hypothetical protein TUM19329_14880 [Legionella antarctica]|uniref:Fe-S protein n=1 Tax=Legionella antarctica TaxID=2708020 RepID=A0A6F8T4P2_9GAMM|nr:hypothetical protein [Legionella antarctica]BCA95127.1 hypothetical protein TUM19329_14880 [Legionella antarctica]
MQQFIKTVGIFIFICTFSNPGFTGPWFTGPILAPAGHTIPKGHTNVEFYSLHVSTDGRYNDSGTIIHTPLFRSFVTNPVMTHGFNDWLDVQLTLPYTFNSTRGVSYNRLTDITTALGFQLVEQNGSPKRADVRILLQQTFPTGKYENLNPAFLGTDSTGLGSYQTLVGLDLQYLLEVIQSHYLRTRLILSYLHASPVKVHGLNSYGGTINTNGRIARGGEYDADLAFEFTLTQNWVAVMEGTISRGQSTVFNGILDIGNIGAPVNIRGNDYSARTLAPALEYNFNANVGLIGGVWFPVSGKNTSHFRTYVLALNAYW